MTRSPVGPGPLVDLQAVVEAAITASGGEMSCSKRRAEGWTVIEVLRSRTRELSLSIGLCESDNTVQLVVHLHPKSPPIDLGDYGDTAVRREFRRAIEQISQGQVVCFGRRVNNRQFSSAVLIGGTGSLIMATSLDGSAGDDFLIIGTRWAP